MPLFRFFPRLLLSVSALWVIRYWGDPAASPATSAVTPKAEVNSDKAHKSNQGYKRDNPIRHYICLIWSDANSTR
jgi:hypothetical protein